MDQSIGQTNQIPPDVRAYLERLLQESDFVSVDQKMTDDMVTEMYASLDHYVSARLVEILPPEKLNEFIKMNEEQRSQVELQQFLQQNIPNYSQFFADIFSDFRQLYLGKGKAEEGSNPSSGTPGPANN